MLSSFQEPVHGFTYEKCNADEYTCQREISASVAFLESPIFVCVVLCICHEQKKNGDLKKPIDADISR